MVDSSDIVTTLNQVLDNINANPSLLLNSISDPLLILDPEFRLLLLNMAAAQAMSIVIEEAQGKPLENLISQQGWVTSLPITKTSSDWIIADRTYTPHIEPIHDSHQRVLGWLLALRDITHYKRLYRNQSEFTRIVSHDLRSPLTAMQGFASMMEMVGELNEKQHHFVTKILSGISQMTALVENIQDAGRYDPESGFYEINRGPCDILEIVKKVIDNHLLPAEKILNVSVDYGDNLPIINADGVMLERAINNLVDNAIKYTPSEGTVTIAVRSQNNQVIVSVRDSGFGISPEHIGQLFERHARIARPEYKKIKGTGLGLFIVRSVARRHGGEAWVESQEGQGSTFFISIPLDGPNLFHEDEE